MLRIEWDCEVEELLNRKDLNPDQLAAIREVAKEMPYCFNTATINKWLDSSDMFGGASHDIKKFVTDDFQHFYMDRYKRLDQLLESMVEKKKDANGNVILGEGFDKNCGLKGSKLSGGQK